MPDCEFHRVIIESLPIPFYVINVSDFTVALANRAARFGELTPASTCYALTHRRSEPCDGAEHPCPLEIVRRTGSPATVEHRHFDADGGVRDVEVHGYPVFDEAGALVRMIEVCLDITDRKRLEREREGLIGELKGALADVRRLSGLLPICASCKKVRDDRGYWKEVEVYVQEHSDADFTHSLCPGCVGRLYPEQAAKLGPGVGSVPGGGAKR